MRIPGAPARPLPVSLAGLLGLLTFAFGLPSGVRAEDSVPAVSIRFSSLPGTSWSETGTSLGADFPPGPVGMAGGDTAVMALGAAPAGTLAGGLSDPSGSTPLGAEGCAALGPRHPVGPGAVLFLGLLGWSLTRRRSR